MSTTIPRELCTKDYFVDEYTRFREVMCSTKYTLEQKNRAFGAITYVVWDVTAVLKEEGKTADADFVEKAYTALSQEWLRRSAYEYVLPPRRLDPKLSS